MSKEQAASILILGGAGDLALNKLLPALARMRRKGRLHPATRVMAAGRRAMTTETFAENVRAALNAAGLPESDVTDFLSILQYRSVAAPKNMTALADELNAWEALLVDPVRVIYLALPPQQVSATLQALSAAGLTRAAYPVRLVVEKPFGHDLNSAQALNALIHEHFDEADVYRIDHYLGKDTVQNLLVLRFANTVFESLWNRDRIESVEIMVAEAAGVGGRAGYYDGTGAVRDMLQNHLLQILTFLAMEVPTRMQARAIRYEKLKVLQALVPLRRHSLVLGQYGPGTVAGRTAAGYLEEPGVAPDSRTETFAALRVEIDNWRWQGVPFYLITGKRLPRRLTRIAVRFRRAPICLFESTGKCMVSSNVLLVTLQPDEGFSLHIDVKVPGAPMRLQSIPLGFSYADITDEMPEAYDTLLGDIVAGDQTLFVHADEVEHAWRFFEELDGLSLPVHPYPAGAWGPKAADVMGIPERQLVRGG